VSERVEDPAEILVVDDHAPSREVLLYALKARGHHVCEAGTGEECLREVESSPPDLVLCDMVMPGMSGLDVLRRLRGDERTRRLPFIMITGETAEDLRLEGIEAGADDYLTKPVQMAQLFARTSALLRTKRLDDEVRRQRDVIDNLLTISAFSPEYAGDRDRLELEFVRRTAELLQAREVVALLLDNASEPGRVVCHPPDQAEALARKTRSNGAWQRMIAEGRPLLVLPDDVEATEAMGLSEGFAGVPIHRLSGEVVGGIAAHGIPPGLRPQSLQILQTLAHRVGSELQLVRHRAELEREVAARTRELREALEALEEANISLEHAQEETLFRLALAAETRDNETANHLRRMGRYTEMLARAVRLDDEAIERMRYASLMHDIGKIGIPDHILQKPGRLSDEEFEVMKTHTVLGGEILQGSDAPVLQMSERIAVGHHERWDGKGYPHGVAGEAIPVEARIVAVADVFDALTSRRRYKRAWSHDESFAHLGEIAGSQLDPQLVGAFLEIRGDLAEVAQMLSDSAA
jgi:response regulator RpfG family c-di-GMP phosphodiesterase